MSNTEWKIVHSDPAPKALLVQPVDDSDLEWTDRLAAFVRSNCNVPFVLVVLPVNDWNKDLSPWEAPAVFGDNAFGCGAPETLEIIEKELIPDVCQKLGLPADIPAVLGGYSLAGFFSLWASYRTERFEAVCAASPSVWFPSWMEFAQKHAPKAKYIYLSLGSKEEKTRNPVMAAVGDCIRKQYELLGGPASRDAILEWNPGNHFKDADIRTAKGFVWCLSKLKERSDEA